MVTGVSKIIREEFRDQRSMDIYQIYYIVSFRLGQENETKLQHTIRGAISHLKKQNFIIQTSFSEYKINEELE